MENMKAVLEHLSLTTSVLTCISEEAIHISRWIGRRGWKAAEASVANIYTIDIYLTSIWNTWQRGKQTWQTFCGNGKEPYYIWGRGCGL